MKVLRSLAFNVCFWVWTVFLAIITVPWVVAFCRPHAVFTLGRFWIGSVFGLLKLFCGIDHRLLGLERLPPGPCIIASKHQSAWDTLIFLFVFDAPCYVLKQELLRIPLFGRALAHAQMIAIDRAGGPRALKGLIADAEDRLAAGRSIVIFPEGTRTAPGDHRPYHPGVAALYRALDVPVVPVALNSGLFWGRRKFVKRPGRILLEVLPSMPPGLPRREFLDRLKVVIEANSERLIAEAGGDRNSAETCG